ncbi:MAG: major facilitator superfamily protein [Rhodospirillales bacterium]|jgi:AAHS family 4-hydroxybenzoate transporter-like MFS transporter|nr:major facilitator superfamily protein [Rhodospirillales bacterium]
MNTTPVVEVSRLLDQRGVTSFHIKLIVWSLFIVFIDGYDIGAIAFAAPELIRTWHVNPADMGPVLSASLVGILFGSAIFGWVGDRYGRKPALIAALLLFGFFTLVAAWATNLQEMTWLRLFAGLGIGGIIPNIVAINAESAPSRMRATLAIVAVGCVPLGGAIPGFVTATLVPHYGWQILFLIGGIVPIVVALAAMIGLPESIKYMALHESHRARLVAVLSAMNPGLTVPAGAKFVIEDERQFAGFNPAYLFRDGLALITPLLWLLFALNLMGYFFLASWMPTLLVAAKLPPATAALAGAAMQVGGTVGALLLCRWIDRRRFFAIAVLFVIAVPVVGSIGFLVGSVPSLLIAAFLAGFCVLGIQSGINVAGALVYPTSLRANGSGWELGIGRLGSIVGPMLGALFVALPVQQLYLWAAVPYIAGAIVCFAIHQLNQARLRNAARAGELRPVAAE